MKSTVLIFSLLLSAPALFASLLFSDNFEDAAGLGNGKWAIQGSAVIVVDPLNPLNHAVRFNSQGSGGDLFSILINYAAAPDFSMLQFSFDFYQTSAPSFSYAGTEHPNSPLPFHDEQWLWSQDGGTPYATTPPAGVWTHISFLFTPQDTQNFGTIEIKFEGVPQTIFFDNVQLEAIPEPATYALVGFGIGLAALIRGWKKRCQTGDHLS